ncbi:uncharacterized protein LOC127876478 [Dreissena polymorpha]|uniref:uncharacterized protein LOC127876478 n=1 Tax=Dreissena polymorpha TaxID=45954 RepID=UPI0022642CF0|nr:uncharacterized protein LOC127876478 [Dreissena polymorpha]
MKVTALIVVCCSLGANAWSFWRSPWVKPREGVTDECLQMAARGDCGFYQCLERRFQCGSEGYALKIGYHLCNKSDEIHSRFTAQGQRYMEGSKVCITNALLPVYKQNSIRCDDVMSEGARAMRTCSYEEFAGMDACTFIRGNMDAYNDMLGTDEISRLMSMGSPRLLARIFIDGARCGATIATERFQSVAGSLNDFMGGVRDSITSWWS